VRKLGWRERLKSQGPLGKIAVLNGMVSDLTQMLMARVLADARIGSFKRTLLALKQLDKALIAVNQDSGKVLLRVRLPGLFD